MDQIIKQHCLYLFLQLNVGPLHVTMDCDPKISLPHTMPVTRIKDEPLSEEDDPGHVALTCGKAEPCSDEGFGACYTPVCVKEEHFSDNEATRLVHNKTRIMITRCGCD